MKLKYVDITVSETRIQKWLVDVGAYNNKQSVDSAIDNINAIKIKEVSSLDECLPSSYGYTEKYRLRTTEIDGQNGIFIIEVNYVKNDINATRLITQTAYKLRADTTVSDIYKRNGYYNSSVLYQYSTWEKITTETEVNNALANYVPKTDPYYKNAIGHSITDANEFYPESGYVFDVGAFNANSTNTPDANYYTIMVFRNRQSSTGSRLVQLAISSSNAKIWTRYASVTTTNPIPTWSTWKQFATI